MPFHYMTLPSGEVHADVLDIASNSMRIKFIQYSTDEGHYELTKSLEDLVIKVEEYRTTQLRESLKW